MVKGICLCYLMLVLFLLEACGSKKSTEIPLVYHSSFPKEIKVDVERIPLLQETQSTWEMFVWGDRMLLSTSEMDNSDYKYVMYSYPKMDFVGYVGPRSIFARGVMVARGCEGLFLKSDNSIDFYQLMEDSLQKVSSMDLPDDDFPVMMRLDESRWVYGNDLRSTDLCDFYIYNAVKGNVSACGVYPNVHDRSQFKDLKTFKGAYMHGIQVKPDGSRVLVYYNATRRYRIYDDDGVMIYDGMMDYSNPSSAMLVSSDRNQVVWHYDSAFATDRYIYLLCMDRPMTGTSYGNPSVQVIGWDGIPVGRFLLDEYITAFHIDEVENRFYGVSADKPGNVFTFDFEVLDK